MQNTQFAKKVVWLVTQINTFTKSTQHNYKTESITKLNPFLNPLQNVFFSRRMDPQKNESWEKARAIHFYLNLPVHKFKRNEQETQQYRAKMNLILTSDDEINLCRINNFLRFSTF